MCMRFANINHMVLDFGKLLQFGIVYLFAKVQIVCSRFKPNMFYRLVDIMFGIHSPLNSICQISLYTHTGPEVMAGVLFRI